MYAELPSIVRPGSRQRGARGVYPAAPGFLVRYPLRTDERIAGGTSPMLLLHGTRDTLIPPADSARLRSRAPAELVLVDGAAHNDIQRFPAYLDALAARSKRVDARRSAPQGLR